MVWTIFVVVGAFAYIAMQHDRRITRLHQDGHEMQMRIAELERRLNNLER